MRTVAALGVAVAVFGAAPAVNAQSLDDQIRDMRIMMQEMQERLEALEAENARLKNEASRDQAIKDQAVNERIEALETNVSELEPADNDLNLYWKEGVRFDSKDGNFKLKLSGRIQTDLVFGTADDSLENVFGGAESGSEFRRARFAVEGTIYKDFGFKAQYDFAQGDSDFKDVWMSYNAIPTVGQLKVGHFKEPFSLDQLTSSKYIDFMERSLADALVPGRNWGAQLSNTFMDERIYYALGIFKDADDYGDSENADDWAITGRIAGTPYNRDENHLLHLGAAASFRKLDSSDNSIRIRQRPEIHIADRYIDTQIAGMMSGINQVYGVDDFYLLGGEAAWVHGPLTLQGEAMMAEYNSTVLASDPSFWGGYLQGSYFITGEGKAYKASDATFDKVKPKKNFGLGENKGPGAWEVLARVSYLDLSDGPVVGGEETNITLGINWYLNPNMKLMFNYVHAMAESDAINVIDPDDPIDNTGSRAAYDGDYDAFAMRFAVFW